MDIFGAARTIYEATKDTPASVAAIRAEFASLALSIATDPAASQMVTSGTVNGQTFTASGPMTQGSRLQMLRLVVKMFDLGEPISRVAKPYF
jgi:hypothetical protein